MTKKIFRILILILVISSFSLGYEQFDNNEKNMYGYEFKQGDALFFLRNANANMKKWEKEQNKQKKSEYLQEAMRYYYLLSKADKGKIEAYIGLGRIYDEMNIDRYAKQNFSIAYNINNKNPELNYRFGDYYFKRKQLQKAHFYYNRAYNFGLSDNKELLSKMSGMYKMLADETSANKYTQNYKTAEIYQKRNFETSALLTRKSKVSSPSNITLGTFSNVPHRKSASDMQKASSNNKELNKNKEQKSTPVNTYKSANTKPVTKSVKAVITSEYDKELEHAKKILLLDDVKSDFSQYYLFIK